MAKKQGGKQIIGAVGGLKIPPVDIWIAGYQYCAKLFNPKIKVLVGYSQDFVASDKCKTVAENQIAQGAQVLFQVAGGCGLGTLKAADARGDLGHRRRQGPVQRRQARPHVRVKRVDNGVFTAIKQVEDGKFKGGGNLLFNLKNNGMDVGKINPAVPQALIDKMNELKQKIISGQVKVPADALQARARRPSPPLHRIPPRWKPPRSSRCGASRSGSPGSSPTTTSTSTCARARCTRCSARTAPASRR